MIEAIPPSSVKSTRLTAVRPPNRLVTPRASKRVTDLAGGHDMAPRPPSLGRAAAEPWRASGSPQDDSSQLSLAAAGGEDALRPEDHHEHEDDAEDHPLVLRRLGPGAEIGPGEPG